MHLKFGPETDRGRDWWEVVHMIASRSSSRYTLTLSVTALAMSALLNACASNDMSEKIGGYAPPDATKAAEATQEDEHALEAARGEAQTEPRTARTSEVPGVAPPAPAPAADRPTPSPGINRPVRVAFEGAPIPAFINAVFGETLKFSLRMDPQVSAKTEQITLRTGDAVPPRDLFDIAAAALKDYGVDVVVESPRTLRFTTPDRQRGGVPQVFRGGSLSGEAFAGDGSIFYYYQIKAASSNSLFTLVTNAFSGRVTLTASPADNALVISGPANFVEAAVAMIEQFDQPRMAGKPAVTYDPIFFTPTKMADALARVLRTAGYSVSTTPDAASVNILPLDEVGSMLIFAADEQVRNFAVDWAKQVDTPRQSGGDNQAYIYFVKNTDVDSVAKVLGAALAGSGLNNSRGAGSLQGDARLPAPGAQPAPGPGAAGAGANVQITEAAGLRIATDPARNALIMIGKAEHYSSILPLLRQLDRSPGEVLIEVVLAEVTLTDNTSLGVEFDLGARLRSGTVNIDAGTAGLVGSGGAGLLLRLLDTTSNASAVINALSRRNRVNILSNPRVVAMSGSDASIQVGTQVPVLRQQTTGVFTGQTGITNSVDYIDTGVVLKVRPVIRGDRRVSLDVSQEVSEAQQNDTSSIGSPLIFTRSLATSLSLQNGQTVLLGGLKSQNRSNTRAGVPGFSRIPGLGAAFRNEAAGRTDTELLVFITPYIVSDPSAANAVVERYKATMRHWPRVSGRLEW